MTLSQRIKATAEMSDPLFCGEPLRPAEELNGFLDGIAGKPNATLDRKNGWHPHCPETQDYIRGWDEGHEEWLYAQRDAERETAA